MSFLLNIRYYRMNVNALDYVLDNVLLLLVLLVPLSLGNIFFGTQVGHDNFD